MLEPTLSKLCCARERPGQSRKHPVWMRAVCESLLALALALAQSDCSLLSSSGGRTWDSQLKAEGTHDGAELMYCANHRIVIRRRESFSGGRLFSINMGETNEHTNRKYWKSDNFCGEPSRRTLWFSAHQMSNWRIQIWDVTNKRRVHLTFLIVEYTYLWSFPVRRIFKSFYNWFRA